MKLADQKYCFECAAIIARDATACRVCGAVQPGLPLQGGPYALERADEGREEDSHADLAGPLPQQTSRGSRWFWVAIVVGALIAAGSLVPHESANTKTASAAKSDDGAARAVIDLMLRNSRQPDAAGEIVDRLHALGDGR